MTSPTQCAGRPRCARRMQRARIMRPFRPEAVHEHAAPARGRRGELGDEDGARGGVPGEDGRDLGADGGCVAAAVYRGLPVSNPKADDEPPVYWEFGTAYGSRGNLVTVLCGYCSQQ
ncbi:hypothetical protein OsJ_15821 [Oryza sativa Japonica Group]|uniref:Uncharacterized protein n=1 Tax=Oryza sativa subsp. japonica TaxID=39947 RepID=B9FC15_ORYSJ|nr:hypothetical protein OsJ_15821 [Oryza sativa Japonica Group]